MHELKIYGFQETSTVDYPGEVASIIFTAGCNLRCPYCYNHRVVHGIDKKEYIQVNEVIRRLKNNKIITAVVISGGEPTIHTDLVDFIRRIKRETGLKIKLFTNGINYIDVLRTIPYIDALSIDYKTYPRMYRELGASPNQIESFKMLVSELRFWNIDLEFRCTLAPWFTNDKIVESIRQTISPRKLITQEACMDDVMYPQFFQDHK